MSSEHNDKDSSESNPKDLWEETIDSCDTEFLKMSLKENEDIDERAIRMAQRIKEKKLKEERKKALEDKHKKSLGYRLGQVLDKLLDLGLKGLIPLSLTIGGLISGYVTGLFETLLK